MNGLNSHVKLRPGGCPPGHLHCSAAQEEGDGPRERVTEGSVRTVTRIGRAEGGGAGTVSALGLALAGSTTIPTPEGTGEYALSRTCLPPLAKPAGSQAGQPVDARHAGFRPGPVSSKLLTSHPNAIYYTILLFPKWNANLYIRLFLYIIILFLFLIVHLYMSF